MIGFVILSHKSPGQLLRLCRALNALYADPPIACHHDFRQSALEVGAFPGNVRFVQPSISTAWAKWSLVQATLDAIGLLYASADPDYFYVLSAADYPTAIREKAESDLKRYEADAWIDHFDLLKASEGDVAIGDEHLAHHRALHNLVLERGRYLQAQAKLPIIRFRPPAHSTTAERYPRLGRSTINLPFRALFSPFARSFRCHVGSQWFTGNRTTARRLMAPSPTEQKLQRYYRSRVVPDESYFQSVLCNAPGLGIVNRTFRYALWDGAHPVDLTSGDFQRVVGSGAHFARKFRENDPVLDLLEEHLGVKV